MDSHTAQKLGNQDILLSDTPRFLAAIIEAMCE